MPDPIRVPASTRALVIGIGGTVVITAVFTWLPPDVPPEVSALLLLVPIAIASVRSGWRVGLTIDDQATGASIRFTVPRAN